MKRYRTCQHHNPLQATESRSETSLTANVEHSQHQQQSPQAAGFVNGLVSALHTFSKQHPTGVGLWMQDEDAAWEPWERLLWQQRVVSVGSMSCWDAKKGRLALESSDQTSVTNAIIRRGGNSNHTWKPSASRTWRSSIVTVTRSKVQELAL